MGWRRSRSMSPVPYVWRLRSAQSSPPRTVGVGASGPATWRKTRSSVCRLTATSQAWLRACRPAPRAPDHRATRRWTSRRVRRAQGAATGGRRSVKMRRPQARFAQNHLRTRHGQRPRYAAHGSSASVRVSRLWRRAAGTAQTGQGPMVGVEVTETVRRDAAVSRHHASRRSEVVSGNKKETNAVPSMQVRCEKASILSCNRHPYGSIEHGSIEPHHQNRARAIKSSKSVEAIGGHSITDPLPWAWRASASLLPWRSPPGTLLQDEGGTPG